MRYNYMLKLYILNGQAFLKPSTKIHKPACCAVPLAHFACVVCIFVPQSIPTYVHYVSDVLASFDPAWIVQRDDNSLLIRSMTSITAN